MANLKKGYTVTIYEDPYTRTKAEGQARIVRYVGTLRPGIDMYLVHFVGDKPEQNVERVVIEGTETAAPNWEGEMNPNEWAVCECGNLVEKIDINKRQVLKRCKQCGSCVTPVPLRFRNAIEIAYSMGATDLLEEQMRRDDGIRPMPGQPDIGLIEPAD